MNSETNPTTIAQLQRDVHALCTHPDRTVGSHGHEAARDYLQARYADLALHPYGEAFEMPYAIGGQRFTNLAAVAPADAGGESAAPIILVAHYDTVPLTPGADDNAAAIAITLEVAKRLIAAPAARPVAIAHFDAEDAIFMTDMESDQGPWLGYDTTATEIATMNHALARVLPHTGLTLKDRDDIDRLVTLLLRHGLL